MKSLLFIVGGLILAAVVLLLLLPSVVYGFEGKLRWREEASQLSPDGRSQVVVQKRVVFPAFDLIDPSVAVRAELRVAGSRKVLASGQVVLMEDSDFSSPTILWDPSEIHIKGFDRRQKQTITLKARNNHSSQATQCAEDGASCSYSNVLGPAPLRPELWAK